MDIILDDCMNGVGETEEMDKNKCIQCKTCDSYSFGFGLCIRCIQKGEKIMVNEKSGEFKNGYNCAVNDIVQLLNLASNATYCSKSSFFSVILDIKDKILGRAFTE